MDGKHIDHLYRETARWDSTVDWWMSLEFTVTDRWGSRAHRGARLVWGGAVVIAAEIEAAAGAADAVFFPTDELVALSTRTGRNIVETHWGSSLISAEDPDGNTYHFETRNEIE